MAASAVNFEDHHLQIDQILGVRTDAGASGVALRPDFVLTDDAGRHRRTHHHETTRHEPAGSTS